MGYTPPQLEVRKITGGYSAMPPNSTTTDDFTIYPNTTDTTANIKIEGAGAIRLNCGTAQYLIYNDGSNRLSVYHATPDLVFESTVADKNIFLKPTGTGVVKFGTYTADATVTQAGYITILDSGGTTRYLSCITP